MKGTGTYPVDWDAIARAVKSAAGWRCVRCRHAHDATTGRVPTTHHLDGDKANCRWWNIPALCQRCHLTIQAHVVMARPWVFEHSEWFRPYAAGFYAKKYLGLSLSREETMARLDELLALESWAVIGCEPIALAVAR